jgi:hypothetical protein
MSHIRVITGAEMPTSSWRGHPTTKPGAREKPPAASAGVGGTLPNEREVPGLARWRC